MGHDLGTMREQPPPTRLSPLRAKDLKASGTARGGHRRFRSPAARARLCPEGLRKPACRGSTACYEGIGTRLTAFKAPCLETEVDVEEGRNVCREDLSKAASTDASRMTARIVVEPQLAADYPGGSRQGYPGRRPGNGEVQTPRGAQRKVKFTPDADPRRAQQSRRIQVGPGNGAGRARGVWWRPVGPGVHRIFAAYWAWGAEAGGAAGEVTPLRRSGPGQAAPLSFSTRPRATTWHYITALYVAFERCAGCSGEWVMVHERRAGRPRRRRPRQRNNGLPQGRRLGLRPASCRSSPPNMRPTPRFNVNDVLREQVKAITGGRAARKYLRPVGATVLDESMSASLRGPPPDHRCNSATAMRTGVNIALIKASR